VLCHSPQDTYYVYCYVYCIITTACESDDGRVTIIFGLLYYGSGCNKTLFLCLMKYVPTHLLGKKKKSPQDTNLLLIFRLQAAIKCTILRMHVVSKAAQYELTMQPLRRFPDRRPCHPSVAATESSTHNRTRAYACHRSKKQPPACMRAIQGGASSSSRWR